jgi:glycosyltransferase involved in cell wall biosynthesis
VHRRLRLLWVTPHLPLRGVSAARERWWHLLARLAPRHDVTLLAFTDAEDAGVEHGLPPGLAAVHRVEKRARVPDDPLALLPRLVRWQLADPSLRAAVAARLAAERFDLVQYEYSELAHVMPPRVCPTLLTVHQLGFAAALPEWRAAGARLSRLPGVAYRYLRDLDFELRAAARVDHVVTMSAEDAARLRRFLPALRVSVSPVGVDCDGFRPPLPVPPAEADAIFVGNFGHPPNVDAARFLVREVLPRLHRGLRVRLVGRNPPPEVLALAAPGTVDVTGPVPDVRPYIATTAIAVAPVRFGTGMRGKVLEALAMARPVVTTSVGAEGLGATAGEHLLVADDAAGLAAAIGRLLDDPALAARLGAAGRALAVARFDWDAIATAHERLYADVLAAPVTPGPGPRDRTATLGRVAAHLGRWPRLAAGAAVLSVRGVRWHATRGRVRPRERA